MQLIGFHTRLAGKHFEHRTLYGSYTTVSFRIVYRDPPVNDDHDIFNLLLLCIHIDPEVSEPFKRGQKVEWIKNIVHYYCSTGIFGIQLLSRKYKIQFDTKIIYAYLVRPFFLI